MTCQVFLQNVSDKSYTATALAFPDCVASGATREEALSNLSMALDARLARGQIVTVEVGAPEHSWRRWAGTWRDDPSYEAFEAEVESYRREADVEQRADLSA